MLSKTLSTILIHTDKYHGKHKAMGALDLYLYDQLVVKGLLERIKLSDTTFKYMATEQGTALCKTMAEIKRDRKKDATMKKDKQKLGQMSLF